MTIKLGAEDRQRLLEALRASEDCEENGDGSFTVDLYEPEEEPVLSVELYPEEDGFAVTAVCRMEYSEEMQGYYLAEKIRDVEGKEQAAARVLALFL
ncbi:MAG: hypothetical protein Q4A66_08150 [Eubacteriales bacterium]|nr:hypothetical protein [Eubacteriales bacterium]